MYLSLATILSGDYIGQTYRSTFTGARPGQQPVLSSIHPYHILKNTLVGVSRFSSQLGHIFRSTFIGVRPGQQPVLSSSHPDYIIINTLAGVSRFSSQFGLVFRMHVSVEQSFRSNLLEYLHSCGLERQIFAYCFQSAIAVAHSRFCMQLYSIHVPVFAVNPLYRKLSV